MMWFVIGFGCGFIAAISTAVIIGTMYQDDMDHLHYPPGKSHQEIVDQIANDFKRKERVHVN